MRTKGPRAAAGAAVVLVVTAAACTPAPPTPASDHQMHVEIDGAVAPCAAPRAPALVQLSSGAYGSAVETVDGKSDHVATFERGGGFATDATNVMPNNSYSVVVLFRLSEIGGYDRLIDFKAGTSDRGVYLYDGRLRFFPHVVGPRIVANNEYVQVVITRATSGRMEGWVDGVRQWEFTDASEDGVLSSRSLIFFRDNVSGGATTEHSAGAVARIRLFARALTPDEIGRLGQTPAQPCAT